MSAKNNHKDLSHNNPTTSLDANYWNTRWQNAETGWDIGYASPAITKFVDGIKDKNIAILIPGCGNAYEADYLIEHGFTNITLIDFAPKAVEHLQEKFDNNPSIKIICGDFFEHEGSYDLILEQTFFCALPPNRRKDYAEKMHELLNDNGSLVGVLFDRDFGNPTPPFGGNKAEYLAIFEPYFTIDKIETCYNSIPPRAGTELFISLKKK